MTGSHQSAKGLPTEGTTSGGYRTAKVIRVVDGDTVVVGTPWHKETLRLDAIDCPEDGQYWGETAKYGLIKLIGGREISFEDHATDLYGRTVATVHVWHHDKAQWINVNARMVTLGHAWVFRGYLQHLPRERRNELFRLEKWARTNKIGLWRDDNPIPPWKWRNSDKRTGRPMAEPTNSRTTIALRYEPSLSTEIGTEPEPASTHDLSRRIASKRNSRLVGRLFLVAMLLFAGFAVLGPSFDGSDSFTKLRDEASRAARPFLASDYVYVTAQAANLRSGPSMERKVIDVVEQGTQLELLGTQGNWHEVRDRVTKRVGWIHRSIVSRQPLP